MSFRLKKNRSAVWQGETSDTFTASDSGEWRVYYFFGVEPTACILTNKKGTRSRVLPMPHRRQDVVFDDGVAGFRLESDQSKWRFFTIDGKIYEVQKQNVSCIIGAGSTDAKWVVGDDFSEPVIFKEIRSSHFPRLITFIFIIGSMLLLLGLCSR